MSPNDLNQVTDRDKKQEAKNEKTKKPSKNGGPYTKNDKDKRRDEIYRLHFEYGYSSRKIAKLMKINRNTINADVDFWYSQVGSKFNALRTPEDRILATLEKMNIQLSRLREQLDKTKRTSERISIERLMYDINSKMINTYQKLLNSTIKNHEESIRMYNELAKKRHLPDRRISLFEAYSVSDKIHEKVTGLIEQDKNFTKS